jgi:hypothetical protein
VNNSTITSTSGAFNLEAHNFSVIQAIAGSGIIEQGSAGLGASAAMNVNIGDTQSYIVDSTVDVAGDVSLTASNKKFIGAQAVTGTFTQGYLALPFSLSTNVIVGDTRGYITSTASDYTHSITAGGDISLNAKDTSIIWSVAGSLGVSWQKKGDDDKDKWSAAGGAAFAGNVVVGDVATTVEGTAIDLSLSGSGSGNVYGENDTIEFSTDHGLKTGDALIYNSHGEERIGGLENGVTYYAIEVDEKKIKLAASYDEAQAGTSLTGITPPANTDIPHSFRRPDNLVLDADNDITLAATGEAVIANVTAAGAAGKTAALGGAGSVTVVTSNIESFIENATVKSAGDLILNATDRAIIGTIALAGQLAVSNKDKKSAAIGGVFGLNVVVGSQKSYLENTSVNDGTGTGNKVSLTATNESINGNIALGGQGAFREKSASIGGSFAVNTIVNETESYIKGATVRTAHEDISLSATDHSVTVAGAGSFQWAGTAAAGAAVAVNTIVNSTSSTVENSALESGRDIKLEAHNVSIIANVAAGAQVATKKDKSGAVGGSIAVNTLVKSTASSIAQSTLLAGNDVALSSSDQSWGGALAGTVQYAGGGVGGAAIAVNTIVDNVEASVDSSTIDADNNVTLTADNKAGIGTVAAGLQYGSKFALGGSVAVTTLVDATSAYVRDNSTLTAGNDILMTARDLTVAGTLSGSVQASKGSAAAGAAIAVNTIVAPVKVYVDHSYLFAGNNVELEAKNLSVGASVAVGGQGADKFAIGGSVAVNTPVNTTEALIKNSSAVHADGDVLLTAEDASYVGALAGSVQIAKGTAAAGAAVSVNTLVNRVSAGIDSSAVSAGGQVLLDSKNVSITGNVAVGAQGAENFALGGSVAVNTIVKTTEAYTSGTGTDPSSVTAWGDISLSAEDLAIVVDAAGSLQISKGTAAAGAAVTVNTVVDTVKTYSEHSDLQSGMLQVEASTVIDETAKTIRFASPHHLQDGDVVVYHKTGDGDMGLENGEEYDVIFIDPYTIQIKESGGEALSLKQTVGSAEHSFRKTSKTFDFDLSTVTVNDTNNTLSFSKLHHFLQGEAVVYYNEEGSIKGLSHERTYYVILVDGNTLKLAETKALADSGEAVDIALATDGQPGLERIDLFLFDSSDGVSDQDDTIAFDFEHHLQTGDEVIYYNGGEDNVGDLETGESYFVIRVDDTSLKLAATEQDAADDKAIDLAPLDNDQEHSLERIRMLTFDPSADVDDDDDTITFSSEHYLETGASVVYHSDSTWRMKGLKDGQTYYVGAIDDFTIQLFKTAAMTHVDNPTPVDLHYDDSPEGGGITLETATGNIALRSSNSSYVANLAVGGQFASNFVIGGSVGVNTVVNTTESYIADDSKVQAAKDVVLKARDLSIVGVLSGSVQGSKGIAVGAAVSVNTVVNTVSTHIAGSEVSAGRDARLDSDMTSVVVNLAAGGGFAQQFAAGGSIAVNTVVNTTEAYIKGSPVTASNHIMLSADNASVLVGAAGSVQGAKGGALGAAVTVNTIVDTVSTRVEDDSNLNAGGNVSLGSQKTTVLASLAVSGQLAETFTAGASVAVNTIVNKTEAVVTGSTINTANGDVSLSARDTSVIGSLVGSVSGSRGASIGAAVAVNTIANDILAYAEESDLVAGRDLLLSAKNLTVIGVAVNTVANRTEAYISGGATLTPTISAGNDTAINASDQSVIVAVAGGLSIGVTESGGGGGSVGVSVAVTNTHNTTQAFISGSVVNANGTVELDANSSSLIVSVSVAGSLGVVTGGGGVVGAGAGAVSVNSIDNTIESYISENSEITTETGSVLLTATDNSDIIAIGGALSLGFAIGGAGGGGLTVGASVAVNQIANTVQSYIAGSTILAGDGVALHAASTSDIISVTIAGAAGGAGGSSVGLMFSGAGSGSDNRVDNTIKSYISDFTNADQTITRSTVETSNHGMVSLTALDNSGILAVAGSLSFSLTGGGVGGVTVTVGASAANNWITNTVQSYIKNSTVGTSAYPAGDVLLSASSNSSILSITVAGAGGGAGGGVGGIVGSGAGSGSGNYVRNIVESKIFDGSMVTAGNSGEVFLAAHDNTDIKAIAGAISGAGGGGAIGAVIGTVGASVAVNDIENSVRSFISGSTVTSDASIDLQAISNSHILSVTVAGAGGGGGGAIGAVVLSGAGSGSGNKVHNTVEAFITDDIPNGKSSVMATDGGEVALAAVDNAEITAIAGALSPAGGGGAIGAVIVTAGASAASNTISNDTLAYIKGSEVYSQGQWLNPEETVLDLSGSGTVDADSDMVDFGAEHHFETGDAVVYSNTDGDITGLAKDEKYYVILNENEIDPFTDVDESDGKESINLNVGHGYATGDSVIYSNGGGASIGNLESGKAYYVITGASDYNEFHPVTHVDDADEKINLGINHGYTMGDAVVYHGDGIEGLVDGSTYYVIIEGSEFDPLNSVDNTHNTIDLGPDHGFSAGDAVIYRSLGGDDIGGLENGETYYIIIVGDKIKLADNTGTAIGLDTSSMQTDNQHQLVSADKISLAETMDDAMAEKAIDLVALTNTGTTHSLVSATKVKLAATEADALSGKAIDLNLSTAWGINHSLTSDTKIKLAKTRADALVGKAIDIDLSLDTGVHYFTRANEVSVTAASGASILSVTIAAAGGGAGGAIGGVVLSGAGAGSGNLVDNTIEASVENSLIDTDENAVVLSATDNSSIMAIAGAASVAGGGGIIGGGIGTVGASISYNDIDNDVRAKISGSTVTSGGEIELSADSDAEIWALTVAGSFSGSGGIVGISLTGAGSSATNSIHNTIEAYITDTPGSGETITAENGHAITLSAIDNSTIEANAAAGSLAFTIGVAGLGVSVGASIANNDIDNTVQTYIKGATVTSGSVELTSSSTSTIEALSIAASISATISIASLGLAGGGASSKNTITNTVAAYIDDNSVVTANGVVGDGAVAISAQDISKIYSDVGSGALAIGAIGASVGVSIADNLINNTVKAYVGDAAVTSSNDDIIITALSNAEVDSLAVATSVALSPTGLAGAGAEASADILSHIEAYAGSDATLSAGKDISLTSTSQVEKAKVQTVGISATLFTAVGSSLAHITVGGSTKAHFDGNVTSAQNLHLVSKSASNASAKAVAVSGGILSGAGADADAHVTPTIETYTGNNPINVTGNVTITSLSEANAEADAVGVAAGGKSVGVSLADVTITPEIKTYIGGGSVTASGGIALGSYHNYDLGGTKGEKHAHAHTNASSGTLIGDMGAHATAVAGADLTTYIGFNATVSAGEDIFITSLSNNEAVAESEGITVAGVEVGVILANATAGGTTSAHVDGEIIQANNLTITSLASNTAVSTTQAYGAAIVGVDVSVPSAVINPTISAYIGSYADVNVGGSVGLASISDADAFLNVTGAGGAAADVGVAVVKVSLSPDVDTYIGSDSKVIAGQGITLTSRHNYDSDGNKLIRSSGGQEKGAAATINEAIGGLANVGVLVAAAESNADVQTYVGTGATLTATAGNIDFETVSNNFAKARANRYAGGAVDVGVLVSRAVSSGKTLGYLNGNAPDSDDVITAGNDLIVTTKGSNTADSYTAAYGGAVVGVNVTVPTAMVDPTIGAYIGGNADVDVEGSVELTSTSDTDAALTVSGAGGAAVKVDVAAAKAEVKPDVDTYINDDSSVVAGQDIILISRHNYDLDGNKLFNPATGLEKGAVTTITEASGGLVDVGVLESRAESNADVQSWVGLGSTLTAEQGNIKVDALSNHFAKAKANRLSIGGVGVGILTSEAKSKGTTIATLKGNKQGSEGSISAGGELAINAKSFITVDSNANGRDYGAAAFGSVIANATMENQTLAFADTGTKITSASTWQKRSVLAARAASLESGAPRPQPS